MRIDVYPKIMRHVTNPEGARAKISKMRTEGTRVENDLRKPEGRGMYGEGYGGKLSIVTTVLVRIVWKRK